MNKRIVVLGAGISGMGAVLLAKSKGFDVFLSDNNKIKEHNKEVLFREDIDFEEKKHTLDIILSADEIIKSPGIPDYIELIQDIKSSGIPIISEIEFAFRYTNAKIAAITGSNGKTTTTLLLYHILKSASYNVLVAGNIGVSLSLSLIDKDYDYIVLEVSSFQLDGIKSFRSDIAILLNISSDHLDRYNNIFSNYFSSKLLITKNQKRQDYLIYNFDDLRLRNTLTKAQKLPISLIKKQTVGGYYDKNKIIINLKNETMTIKELALQGKHNIFNSMAAAMAARVFEVQDSVIRQSLIDFENLEHRLEHVITVHGVDYVNDSKATNVNASWYALESMKRDVIWIAGGVDKGNDYSKLIQIAEEKVKAIICLGENNEKIINSFKGKVNTIISASNMKEAVNYSYNIARKDDVVLLSPACASFDLFDNYEDRGIQFKQEVRRL